MSRRPARVTQADVARAIRAADQCASARVVEIAPDGTIRLVPFTGERPPAANDEANPLDDGKPIDL